MFKRICCLGLALVAVATLVGLPHTNSVQAETPYKVAIIAVDTFGEDGVGAPDEEATECILSAEEQGYAIRGVSAEDTLEAHGDLVSAELTESLEALGITDEIEIIPVTLTSDTETLVADIQAAIDGSEADYFVLHMSFAIIPCEFLEAMQAFGGEFLEAKEARDMNNFRGIFQRAVTFYNGQVFPANSQHFQEMTDLHPLQTLLADNPNVIAVASAGNFGLDYPFWPGAFGDIISVSASTGEGFEAPSAWIDSGRDKDKPLLVLDGTPVTRISNYGEIMMPGEFTATEEGGAVIGTSFAAPRLSALIAVYLANVGEAHCVNDEGAFGLLSDDFNNLTLSEAVTASCPDMATYIPE